MRNSKNKVLISVIMPVYNGGRYLKNAIESILNQTFKDFEFIIINDGSVDESLDIIGSFKDERIILINRENRGLAVSLNEGLQVASGKYIARMDADDIAMPNRLAKQYAYMQRNKNTILLGSAVSYIDEDGNFIGTSYPYIGKKVKYYLRNRGNVIAHPSTLFVKKYAILAGGYSEKVGKYFEDHYLWAKMLKYGDVNNLSIPLLKYRISSDAVSSIGDQANFNKKALVFINKHLDDEPSHNELKFIKERADLERKLLKEDRIKVSEKRIQVLKSKENSFKIRVLKKIVGEKKAIWLISYIKSL